MKHTLAANSTCKLQDIAKAIVSPQSSFHVSNFLTRLCPIIAAVIFAEESGNINMAVQALELARYFSGLVTTTRILLVGSPEYPWSTSVLLWITRVIMFSLVLRTYLGPWLLRLMSKHIRIRSISLRSIRGLYFHKGTRTLRVDRISYAWTVFNGSRRFAVKIDGLTLEIGVEQQEDRPAPMKRHNHNLTLADLDPSPLARKLRGLFSGFHNRVDAIFRPILRAFVVACLRLAIRWLPAITQALSFELQNTVITFAAVAGAKIVAEEIDLNASVEFMEAEPSADTVAVDPRPRAVDTRKAHGVAAWKNRMTEGFRRSLDRAWAMTRGKGKVGFTVYNVKGTMPQNLNGRMIPFLLSPGKVEMSAAMEFNPRAGTIETHTLEFSVNIGHCSAKVDLWNDLLNRLKLSSSSSIPLSNSLNPPQGPGYFDIPPSSSSMFPTPRASAAFQSSIPSFASSLFSPVRKSPASALFSPTTGNLLSPTSMKSPTSPFLRAISASMRPRRRHYVQPSSRLKDYNYSASLSVLKKINIVIASINLSVSSETPTGPYNAVIQKLDVAIGLATFPLSRQHKEWLGNKSSTEKYDADTYFLNVDLKQVTLERATTDDALRLMKVGSINCHVIIHQWPAPLLVTSSFIRGDPNSPFLGINIRIGDIEATQRLDQLRQLLESLKPPKQGPVNQTPLTSAHPSPPPPSALPRITCTVECGSICARLIFNADVGKDHRAIELRTKGFSISAHSEYRHASLVISRRYPMSSSILPVQMEARVDAVLEPVLVHIRTRTDVLDETDQTFMHDPAVVSIGMVQLSGAAHAVAETDGPAEGAAVLDKSTLIFDIHSTVETICIELWHPIVVDSLHQILSVMPVVDSPSTNVSTGPRFRQLPSGVSASASLSQFVIFVTAPDINPNDSQELSRGLCLRFAGLVEYCALRASHDLWFEDHERSQTRSKLHLPTEPSIDAVTAGKTLSPTQDMSAFVKLRMFNTALKSVVATQREPGEPVVAVKKLDVPSPRDFIRVKSIQVELCLSCDQANNSAQFMDICNMSIHIPSIRGSFKIAHVYSMLLALQTLSSMRPPGLPRSSHPATPQTSTKVRFFLQLDIKTIQIFWTLPKRNIVTRIDEFGTRLTSDGPPRLRMNKFLVFVPLPARVDRWKDQESGLWDELLHLQSWEIYFSPHNQSLSVAVEGESARLRIPHGFIFADLVLDATVTLKAVRHIAHMATAGRFSRMPSPEAEGPKTVPHLTFRLRCLCIEAQDDPFESTLSLIWQAGFEAAKQRLEREEAFSAKVAAIMLAEQKSSATPEQEHDFQFGPNHTVPIVDARRRLDDVHALDWTLRLEKLREVRLKEANANTHQVYGTYPSEPFTLEPDLVPVRSPKGNPPLLRAMLHDLCLTICPPSFPLEQLGEFLKKQGNNIPPGTKFSLLVPMHVHFTLSALRVVLRDYPLPLLNILPHNNLKEIAWSFDTDLVIGEEMGTDLSVDWIDCPIIEQNQAVHGEAIWSISVPKTIMPVKTYANATIEVKSPSPTILSWGISYGPAIQDLMRVVETLSSAPRDPSPVMGFWDKLRLIMHWKLKIAFVGDVHVYLKGSRDPYNTLDTGAGFVLAWQGNPHIHIGHENEQNELIQVISDMMLIAVPNLEYIAPNSFLPNAIRYLGHPKPFQKICARLNSGVRYGIGFMPERSCGVECSDCVGTEFHRKCRFFSFKPHYEIILEKKPFDPKTKGPDDSYNGFRSDFVHLSFSVASSLQKTVGKPQAARNYSSFHLTPKLFAHFWAWCALFDGVLTLPIRQGSYYPPRPISPKLGRHIATLKYRISVPHLYVMHGYIDDSRETWVDGATPWVGVKGMVDEFQADMHQREEESIVPGPIPGTTRTLRRKPFYAAEVVLKGLDLRALVAIYLEPLKQSVPMTAPPEKGNYRKHSNLPMVPTSSPWHDLNDFVELDWHSSSSPTLHLLPVTACPRFTYFKRTSSMNNGAVANKFGSEHSHICLLEKEPSVPRVQILLASGRAAELRRLIRKASQKGLGKTNFDLGTAEKMVTLLEDYVTVLQSLESGENAQASDPHNYFLPSEIVSPAEWAEFENVYQIHCPSVFLDDAVRDIMMQYYYCSRARKGLEYHMATRAVKFIRDQAKATLAVNKDANSTQGEVAATAQFTASALRKIFQGDNPKTSLEISRERWSQPARKTDPLDGWAEGVALHKSHCCLLLKPQIVLRGTGPKDTCIVAAAQAKLQSYAIMDILNMDDPVSGKVMSRNYTSLSGLQAYSPTNPLTLGNGSIPLEVLIDLRCESNQFERLVPQTDAVFHYDKFNRLRLRNKVTSIMTSTSIDESGTASDKHLQDQTDLIRVHIPRFTVSANAEHFQAISNIVTKLLLFSDAAHKTRLDRLETLIFTYDFTDLASAANVISSLQGRLRDALETQKSTARNPRRMEKDDSKLSLLKLKAHVFLLEEELNLLFDAIKLAQDRFDNSVEQNSALLLHASSSEISWRMLDERRNLLSKLVVQDIDFHWLSRQDSSTVNHLAVGNLTAFDGSRYAMWAEILSKYNEPVNHPLLKQGLFLLANWTILSPVGGITIYEDFELSFHPLRLQIDAKVGRRIMEYVWPARREREQRREGDLANPPPTARPEQMQSPIASRSSIDSPRALQIFKTTDDIAEPTLTPPLRKLGASRSFTDLRASKEHHSFLTAPTFLQRNRSTESIHDPPKTPGSTETVLPSSKLDLDKDNSKNTGDAAVMKTRSSQKSFVLVRISSLNLLLSIVKEGSFECRDARIRTRDLEYRNQTWSFEELVNQFIPSNMSWRGWVKMAFHQPLLPVLPVAKELISKTKWTASSKNGTQPHEHPLKLLHPRILATDDDSRLNFTQAEGSKSASAVPQRSWKNPLRQKTEIPVILTSQPLSTEPEQIAEPEEGSSKLSSGRKRVKSLFTKKSKISSKGDATPQIPAIRRSGDTSDT